ncbi:MAG: cytochrome c oxidase subunit 3 family protein [Bdellovibrionales bacterium]|nr:cytochrome c oxidase subunit 3 family protein [Bdellovibrionales bacterium]
MAHAPAMDGNRQYAHHFLSADHEFETSKQGIWLFLLQEVLFFSPLFVAYYVFRGLHPADWHAAAQLLDWRMGALNTVILICSSLTMALAVHGAQTSNKKKLVVNLILTLGLACGFLVVKYFEYTHKFHMGIYPAGAFTYEGLGQYPAAKLYFSIYYAMTGLHGIHVLGGMAVMLWVLKRAMRGEFNAHYYTPVEMTGLYWHFVDLVWIYLFPILYLLG